MYRRMQFGPGFRLTQGIKTLMIANAVIFIFQGLASPEMARFIITTFGIVPRDFFGRLHIWQPITYLFLHGSLSHIFLNMFALWMFGTELETIWGRTRFLRYFFITGAGAGLVTIIFQPGSPIPVIGASGAVYGILLAYGLRFPEREAFVFPLPVPIKMKYFVLIFGLIEFFSSFSTGMSDGVAHFTHLSGMLIGYIYLRKMRGYKNFRRSAKYAGKDMNQTMNSIRDMLNQYKSRTHRNPYLNDLNARGNSGNNDRKDVDRILDKISRVGYEGLTAEEKQRLLDSSSRLSGRDPKD